ncbi:CYTH domain-containing protein [Xylella taiwanensis]|uniref:Adenylate cyclase n=1 Tax=Xylella taiwanensis TaxID=1444770 RepID=Z9JM00_9GAMM|nr:CYTH domain-containing protein [Xylella taiwanensis]AXI83286.1 CYTH domain protein [Xylella taiwanensis]EWS79184.1 adenylate cyclase [Xylella taiwanensis]MCD8456353.1 CYTH domain-containing protein [Xylella taiwanensis]MCD8458761.1 CYTH domain-containing protein [Xylella taiwanensis]MCD8460897.1 CYTH domain-containing protein [Xylella taiwanensis]
MPIEIERKFLVVGESWRAAAHVVIPMTQGYINDQKALGSGVQKVSVRVRIQGEEAYLNLKSVELGHTRQEFEYAIPLSEASDLLALCVGGLIDKRRHLVRYAGHVWEVDEFFGDNAGLVVAEIELDSADEDFVWPDWLGAEVTDDARYYSLALASHPFVCWCASV